MARSSSVLWCVRVSVYVAAERRGFNTSYCLCKVKRPPAQKIKKMTTIIRAYDYYESKLGTTRRKGILIDKIFREKNMIFSVHGVGLISISLSLPQFQKNIF